MTVKEIIEKHYRQSITDEQVIDELVNLRRKYHKGNLDDHAQSLYDQIHALGKMWSNGEPQPHWTKG